MRHWKCVFLLTLLWFPASEILAQQASSSGVAAQIADLQRQLKKAQEDIRTLQTQLGNLGRTVLSNQEPTAAIFDPSSPGLYMTSHTSIGAVLVSFGKAEPYLDGHKVQIEVGNPLSATITTYDLFVEWAPRFNADAPGADFQQWLRLTKQKTFSPMEPLKPGRWTRLELILPDTAPKDFGWFSIQVSVKVVGLPRD
jgi:hypothetical protein